MTSLDERRTALRGALYGSDGSCVVAVLAAGLSTTCSNEHDELNQATDNDVQD